MRDVVDPVDGGRFYLLPSQLYCLHLIALVYYAAIHTTNRVSFLGFQSTTIAFDECHARYTLKVPAPTCLYERSHWE